MSALSPSASRACTDWFGDVTRTCRSIRAHLHECVDGELDLHVPAERAIIVAVANHVAECDQCARFEAQLQAMHAAVAAVGARMHTKGTVRSASVQAELAIVRSASGRSDHRPTRAD